MAKYIYYNMNPDGNKENDCVTRALSLCLEIPYHEVRKQLFHTARLLNCEKLCVCCYKFLIEDVHNCKRVNCDDMYPNEFADLHPYGTYLLRMNGHICSCVDGAIIDIFDSRYYSLLTDVWQVNKG